MSTIKENEDLALVINPDADLVPMVRGDQSEFAGVSPIQIHKGVHDGKVDGAYNPNILTDKISIQLADGSFKTVTLSKAGAVSKDANGNLLASVILRQDTLDNLLDITDAGDGEVAVCSDRAAMVLFRGDPTTDYGVLGWSKYNEANIAEFVPPNDEGGVAGRQQIDTGVQTILHFQPGTNDQMNVIDEANDEIVIPRFGSDNVKPVSFNVKLDISDAYDITTMEAWLELDVTGTGFWVAFGYSQISDPLPVVGIAPFVFENLGTAGGNWRIQVRHDAPGTKDISFSGVVTFNF